MILNALHSSQFIFLINFKNKLIKTIESFKATIFVGYFSTIKIVQELMAFLRFISYQLRILIQR